MMGPANSISQKQLKDM